VGAERAAVARRSDKRDRAIMVSEKWELDGRELGMIGKL